MCILSINCHVLAHREYEPSNIDSPVLHPHQYRAGAIAEFEASLKESECSKAGLIVFGGHSKIRWGVGLRAFVGA